MFGRPDALLQYFHNRTGAALADAAQAFFIQGGQAARFVARGRLAGPAVLSCGGQMLFVGPADFNDLVVDFFIGRPFGQYMLAADPFNGFAHHGGGSHVY